MKDLKNKIEDMLFRKKATATSEFDLGFIGALEHLLKNWDFFVTPTVSKVEIIKEVIDAIECGYPKANSQEEHEHNMKIVDGAVKEIKEYLTALYDIEKPISQEVSKVEEVEKEIDELFDETLPAVNNHTEYCASQNEDYPDECDCWLSRLKKQVLKVVLPHLATSQHDRDIEKEGYARMKELCEMIIDTDKTPRYSYGSKGKNVLNNKGELAGSGQRWLTPYEIAQDEIRLLNKKEEEYLNTLTHQSSKEGVSR